MVDRDLILHKLHRLQGYIDELKEARDITWEVYQKDLRSKRSFSDLPKALGAAGASGDPPGSPLREEVRDGRRWVNSSRIRDLAFLDGAFW